MLIGKVLAFWNAVLNINLPEKLQTPNAVGDLIQKAGFSGHFLKITTEDGYHLGMHHILPQTTPRNKHVLLMHAAFTAGGQFVINGNKSLAFMLSNQGYDVWILHARGTSYSLGHKSMSTDSRKYWNFSWHEIGLYDIPCAIDYILRNYKARGIHFVGHSQGPTAFFVMLHMRPEYNEKIISAYLLGPAVFVHHTYLNLRFATNYLAKIAEEQGLYKIQFKESALLYFLLNFCKGPVLSVLCTTTQLYALGGDTGEIVDRHAFKHTVAKYARDNMAVKQLLHYSQLQNSMSFKMYDYGWQQNFALYGTIKPPEYNLSSCTVPLMIAYGTKDSLTTAEDVRYLISKLRTANHVIKLPWNHVDMIFGKSVDTKLYNHIIISMNRY